ncbi:hypothetical protein [Rubritalea tangerina]|uniref:hypothetical protein n=1 Tax=Rubritalea tangerina TaxID=430798 RepID=UPI003617FAD4
MSQLGNERGAQHREINKLSGAAPENMALRENLVVLPSRPIINQIGIYADN